MPDIMKKAQEKGVKIHLPSDYVCADKFAEDAKTMIRTNTEGIDDGWLGLDIGPKTIAANAEVIRRSKTIFWNGPQGVFEIPAFAQGSLSMLDEIIAATQKGFMTIIKIKKKTMFFLAKVARKTITLKVNSHSSQN